MLSHNLTLQYSMKIKTIATHHFKFQGFVIKNKMYEIYLSLLGPLKIVRVNKEYKNVFY